MSLAAKVSKTVVVLMLTLAFGLVVRTHVQAMYYELGHTFTELVGGEQMNPIARFEQNLRIHAEDRR